MNDTISRSNCDLLWTTLYLDLIVTFYEQHYLDLIVTFVTFLWTTLDLIVTFVTFLLMTLSRSNCDLFMNDTI